jgi:hypothetical protein
MRLFQIFSTEYIDWVMWTEMVDLVIVAYDMLPF